MLDRKIRQMQFDLPKLEKALHLAKGGSMKPLVLSKVARMGAVLDELQKDQWLSRATGRHRELARKIAAPRQVVEAAKAQAEKIEDNN